MPEDMPDDDQPRTCRLISHASRGRTILVEETCIIAVISTATIHLNLVNATK